MDNGSWMRVHVSAMSKYVTGKCVLKGALCPRGQKAR
ncbi:hypothetical protein Goarm_010185 [Gossypium armourianum]|uniref:Uncharacterized protein n=1 Tax=Gossypium armourianum TaxID=34283 RepID=A0A7J9JVE5_9ROSI|nr:hypothetical protein [Gossypium armourianum]